MRKDLRVKNYCVKRTMRNYLTSSSCQNQYPTKGKEESHLLDTLPRMFRWQLRAAVRWPAYSREGGQCPSPTCSCLFVINMGQVNTRDVGAKTLSPLSSHHMAECPTHPEPDGSPASCGTWLPCGGHASAPSQLTGEAPGSPENLWGIRLVCSNRANSSLAFLVST